MTVAVIVPWRADGDPYTHVVCEAVVEHYQRELPVDELLLVGDDGHVFSRGRAVNSGVARSTSDVLVIADPSTLVPGANLRAAVDFARDRSYVVPFDSLVAVDKAATHAVIRGDHSPFVDWHTDYPDRVTVEALGPMIDGGVAVTTRAAFEQCGGYDPRILVDAYSDVAHAIAMQALVGDPMWLHARAVRLWTPTAPEQPLDGHETSEQVTLCQRYELAAGNADRVRAVVDERVSA